MFRLLITLSLLLLPLSATGATFTRTGAIDVDISGTLYDVEFVSGTCEDVFDSCDIGSGLLLDELTALRVSFTLSRLIDTSPDIDANLTIAGCSEVFSSDVCYIHIPYIATFNPSVVSYMTVENWELIDDDADGYSSSCCMRPDFDTSRNQNETFARWTLSSDRPAAGAIVPLPASAIMMMTVVGGLFGGILRRKKLARSI